MGRLAGYQAFCWLALAFYTLGPTSTPAAAAVLASGLALTVAGELLRRRARHVLSAPAARP